MFRYIFRKSKAKRASDQLSACASDQSHVLIRQAKYKIGHVVRHKRFSFRGIIFDVDPEFANSEEWYAAIPEDVRPHRNQPYYHLFAENEDGHYTAYVSEQNLVIDQTNEPISNPDIEAVFTLGDNGQYQLRETFTN